MLVRDTVVALAINCESFYLMKITEEEKGKMEDVEDGFGHIIKKGTKHLEGVFLERKLNSYSLYTIPKKVQLAHLVSFFVIQG